MEKVFKVFAVFLLCFTVVGCGSGGKPSGLDSDVYDLGNEAVSIVNSCLKSEITADDAYDKIEKLNSKLEKYDNNGHKRGTTDEDWALNDDVSSSVSLLGHSLYLMKITNSEDTTELENDLKYLEFALGKISKEEVPQ